jgi:hypothetical protein
MKKLRIWRLIFANLLILGLMCLILFLTPNEPLLNQTIIGTYIILILLFNGYILD